MVIAALASLQRISRDVNGMSVAIDNVNMRQVHFKSVLKAGGRIVWPKVECGEFNTKPMAMASNKMLDAGSHTAILGDSEGCLSGSKLEHTDIAASDLFNSPIVQNVGLIDLVESPRRVEVPSQPDAKPVVSCSCSNSVRSRCTPVQGNLALEEGGPVAPQVNRVQEEMSGSLDVGELNENIEKLTKLLANINMAVPGRRMGPVKCFPVGKLGTLPAIVDQMCRGPTPGRGMEYISKPPREKNIKDCR